MSLRVEYEVYHVVVVVVVMAAVVTAAEMAVVVVTVAVVVSNKSNEGSDCGGRVHTDAMSRLCLVEGDCPNYNLVLSPNGHFLLKYLHWLALASS